MPLPPPHAPRVGIVGAGQLARMLLQAAIPLGLRIRLLAERSDDGAAIVAPDVTIGSPSDEVMLAAFARSCDVITFDHELVPPRSLAVLECDGTCLRPSGETMRLAQNKRQQRETFARLGLPGPSFITVDSVDSALTFAQEHNWNIVLKASQGGYDGRGVWMVESEHDVARVVRDATERGVELIAEERVPLDRELAILVARRPSGEMAVYPLVETVQVAGMCREVISPAPVEPEFVVQAQEIARTIAAETELVGLLAVELFLSNGRIMVNEIATRPHNSGHYSIEGCVTSQFEQHLRAILDWPLGDTAPTAPAVVTVNVVGGRDGGDPTSRLSAALAVPGAHVHLYGKEPRPGRKLGHVTVRGDDLDSVRSRANAAAGMLVGEPHHQESK